MSYLYRNLWCGATSVCLVVVVLAARGEAQLRDRTQHEPVDTGQNQSKINARQQKRGARAIAVVEFLPGKGTRLVPVALWIDGQYHDASLYGANPEPIALQPETLYEVLDTGEGTGWFTVTAPHQDNGTWVGDGQWKPRRALDEQLAAQAAKQPKKKAPSMLTDDEGPPVLRRPGANDSPNSTSGASSGNKAPANTSGGANSAGGTGGANGGNTPPRDTDPDRPTLKKPQQESTDAGGSKDQGSGSSASAKSDGSENTPSTMTSDESDPNRPVLRRGKPPAGSTSAQVTLPPLSASLPVSATSSSTASISAHSESGKVQRSFAAISDAGTIETRPLLYAIPEGERQRQLAQMSALAMQEISKFSGQHNLPAPAKTAALVDADLRTYDLDFSNSPTLVLTGKLPFTNPKMRNGPSSYFVTLVAHEDIEGNPQKIFASVTTNSYLDAFPRMELVDAVDADANGRGDLLFRQYSDTGISYSLYRVYPYQMVKVFEGGASM